MKEFLIFLPLTIVYLGFKSTLFANIPVPDLPLIIAFFMAYRKLSIEGVLLAFVLGYIDDAFGGGIMGSTSFSLIFIFLSVHLLSKIVHFSTPAIRAGGAGAAALVKGILTYYILRFANLEVHFLPHVLLQAVMTGIFAPAIITLLMRIITVFSPHTFKDNAN